MWFKRKATTTALVSHRLCRQPCFPEEFAVTSVPCFRAASFPANQTASPSADPAASSGNSGSLSGHGCYCMMEWKTESVKRSTSVPLRAKAALHSFQSAQREESLSPSEVLRLLVEQNIPFSALTQWLFSRRSHSATTWEMGAWPAGPRWEWGWEWTSWSRHTLLIVL